MGFNKNSKAFFAILGIAILIPGQLVYAADYEFERIDGDVSKDPVGKKFLEKIEESKRILAKLKAGNTTPQKTDHQKFIDEQRKLAKEKLQEQLSRMNKEYEPFTPRNAYSTFLGGVNGTYHDLYWDQFNYMEQKVKLAKAAKNKVLASGGTFSEAFAAYVKYASMTRAELIQLNQELNIKHGFADANIQKAFDRYGKLPRYN